MPDKDEFQQWVETLEPREVLGVYFADCPDSKIGRLYPRHGVEIGWGDFKTAMQEILDAYRELGPLASMEALFKRAARNDLRQYFDTHRADCLERLEPRENGLTVEQRNPSLGGPFHE